jgi:hypothetical protein
MLENGLTTSRSSSVVDSVKHTAQRVLARGFLAAALIQGPVSPVSMVNCGTDMQCHAQQAAKNIEGARVITNTNFIGAVYRNGECGVGFVRRLGQWEPYENQCPTGYKQHPPYRPWEL